jgi:hypothetical protein
MTNQILRIILFFICDLFFITNINAQKLASKKLFTGENIDWSDYKGEINYNYSHSIAALSIFSLEYKYDLLPIKKTDSMKINISVQVFFSDSSWVKPNKRTDYILNHEKGHLVLGLIAAKECENRINNETFNKNEYKNKIDSIFRENDSKFHKLQNLYDLETNNSINKDEQLRWDKIIHKLLKEN